MRNALLAGSMFALVACSESFGAMVTNPCPTPIEVEVEVGVEVGSGNGSEPEVVSIGTGETVDVWSYCCAPGADGELALSVGQWSTSVTFDELRQDSAVAVPRSACPTP